MGRANQPIQWWFLVGWLQPCLQGTTLWVASLHPTNACTISALPMLRRGGKEGLHYHRFATTSLPPSTHIMHGEGESIHTLVVLVGWLQLRLQGTSVRVVLPQPKMHGLNFINVAERREGWASSSPFRRCLLPSLPSHTMHGEGESTHTLVVPCWMTAGLLSRN